MDVVDLKVIEKEVLGAGGFLQLHRCRLQHQRSDGSWSETYRHDVVERPCGDDAVVVVAYEGSPARVLLRRAVRPALRLGRAGRPLRRGSPAPLGVIEAVAGIVEPRDVGPAGLLDRAVAELEEEAGLHVVPQQLEPLGPPAFLSTGAMAEQIFFFAVHTALDQRSASHGDGSALEADGSVFVTTLKEALAWCDSGHIEDVKTECALRRLAARLAKSEGPR